MGIVYRPERWHVPAGYPFSASPGGPKVGSFSKAMVVTSLGPSLDPADSDGIDYSYRAVLVTSGAVTGESERKVVWIARPTGDPVAVGDKDAWENATWGGLNDPTFTVYPCPPGEDCPDPEELISAAVASRDERWEDALRRGEAWPSTETAGPENWPDPSGVADGYAEEMAPAGRTS